MQLSSTMALVSSNLTIIVVLVFCVSHAQGHALAVCKCEKTPPTGKCVCQSDNSNPAVCKVCLCDHITTYVKGLPVCSCRPGYAVSSRDRKQCIDIDECKHPKRNPCQQICTNTVGNFSCSCSPGYTVSRTNPSKCDDIDECNGPTGNPCQQICTNTVGSFSCSCSPGYTVSGTNPRTCDDINECSSTSDPVCDQICTNTNGRFLCSCRDGYTINSTDPTKCDDINECSSTSQFVCDQICTNTNGSYLCSCRDGYTINPTDPTKCDDINECTDTTNPVCEQSCTNTPGSFSCSCGDGYTISTDDPTKCVDINECTDPTTNSCQQICTNTIGSYSCSCNPGYIISTNNPNMCKDCGQNWMLRPGTSFCYQFVQSTMNWFDAQTACGGLGGALASIASQDEQEFIADQMKNQTRDMWIGFSDKDIEGTWTMENENCVNYTNWGSGEPVYYSRGSGYNCAIIQLYTTYNSSWLNTDGVEKSYPFICKKNIADEIPVHTENTDCSAACSSTPRCSGYFYANGHCTLYVYKEDVPHKVSKNGFTSGYVQCQTIY